MTGREIYEEIKSLEIEIGEFNDAIDELHDRHFKKTVDIILKLKEEKSKTLAVAESRCFDSVPCNIKRPVKREGDF